MQRVFGDVDALRFVDNRLDDERRAAFMAHLHDDAEQAERVDNWSRQNDVIRAAFSGVANEPVPLWLRLGNLTPEREDPNALAEVVTPLADPHPGADDRRRARLRPGVRPGFPG